MALKEELHELALFAGAGGGILGGHLLGWRTVCAVEFNAYAASVLVARQNDGCLAPFPIWDDVRTFDGRPWRGRVDVVSGGFPCQDISAAGKGAGLEGERSGLWQEMVRIVGEVRPQYVLVENSPMLVSRGLGRVLGDLAALGYDARWGVLGAVHAGAPHIRERIWIVADSKQDGCARCLVDAGSGALGKAPRGKRGRGNSASVPLAHGGAEVADAYGLGCDKRPRQGINGAGRRQPENSRWWSAEPRLDRVAHGVADRVDRIAALGNGQVPGVVRLAWETLNGATTPPPPPRP